MYILPGYVSYYEENGAIYITSKLRRNTVRLTDPDAVKEFEAMIRCGGCTEIATPLSRFLHQERLLENGSEIRRSIQELKDIIDKTLHITIMPTERCNFRCLYCYEDHVPISMRQETLEMIQKYIAQQTPHFQNICIGWFGGEPTLCKDSILETSQLVQELQKKHGFNYRASMTTNGYLLSWPDFKQYYDAGIRVYQITLDGWNHDQSRPHVTGKGTLKRILDNLTAISMLPKEQYSYHILLRHNILRGGQRFRLVRSSEKALWKR